MNRRLNPNLHERWAIILAGGDGSRLMPLCRKIIGCSAPKQLRRLSLQLWEQGCLWNTFVMVGKLSSFILLTVKALPELASRFSTALRPLDRAAREEASQDALQRVAVQQFLNGCRGRNPRRLGVLKVSGVYWNDLGEPRRVFETLARTSARPAWLKRGVTASGRERQRILHTDGRTRRRT
jgi:mannose-1-phosphate guanylyltransferase